VELARALSTDPHLLLLDEPCSGLDDAESEALGKLLRDLASEGRSVLLVEHDMQLVLEVCDLVHVLDFGEVIASGTPDQIRQDPQVQAAYLGQMEVPEEEPGAAT
jgi:branched-chain amino acid transport system ATP-binding protein